MQCATTFAKLIHDRRAARAGYPGHFDGRVIGRSPRLRKLPSRRRIVFPPLRSNGQGGIVVHLDQRCSPKANCAGYLRSGHAVGLVLNDVGEQGVGDPPQDRLWIEPSSRLGSRGRNVQSSCLNRQVPCLGNSSGADGQLSASPHPSFQSLATNVERSVPKCAQSVDDESVILVLCQSRYTHGTYERSRYP